MIVGAPQICPVHCASLRRQWWTRSTPCLPSATWNLAREAEVGRQVQPGVVSMAVEESGKPGRKWVGTGARRTCWALCSQNSLLWWGISCTVFPPHLSETEKRPCPVGSSQRVTLIQTFYLSCCPGNPHCGLWGFKIPIVQHQFVNSVGSIEKKGKSGPF